MSAWRRWLEPGIAIPQPARYDGNLPEVSTGTPICVQIAMLTCFTCPPDLASAVTGTQHSSVIESELLPDPECVRPWLSTAPI
jgi:hypothetical protein